MKKELFKKALAGICFTACALMNPAAVNAVESVQTDECAKELLLSYFPAPIVKETLKKFEVPQDKWDNILNVLSQKDKEIVKLVEQKASSMNPNPLKDPQQRQAAVKLFRETLFEAFSNAMQGSGITDTTKYQAMLDDIQQQKAKKFAMCMEKQKQKAENLDRSPVAKDASDEEDKEDSDDDSDDSDEDDSDDDSDDEDSDEDDDNEESTDEVKTEKTAPSAK